ncbi:hypothetical protein P3S68_008779 [Capsicum galapagoense]
MDLDQAQFHSRGPKIEPKFDPVSSSTSIISTPKSLNSHFLQSSVNKISFSDPLADLKFNPNRPGSPPS